ncbi:esterase family protein [Thermophilibacter provencensis]|uniref:Alpha/beta hydrolase-fold protein n=1 Tax=Thermophilibacter provencensis TaxID=1852386 RepID=A0ABT7V5I0_9ACTN|nr:alpha/beta hydrolase-fold protein [Thermophilibacter provencensis]MDM8271865.1 alpha/beta hydrolase-fold protein [Thermophilibacter provencensis]
MDKKNVACGSAILGRDMHVNVYGKKGLPVVVFPTMAASPESIEEVGIVDELADYLDSGTIQLFCTETVDAESWGGSGDPAERAQLQESFYHYVVDELVPLVHKVSKSKARPLALGFDLGATHAAIALLRRPDLFQGCMCLSGCYDARRYFGDWMDATLYDNTPCAFLPNMPADHPYVAVYNQRQLLFCTGQDVTEADCLRTTREMDANLARLGVEAWCDYWGGDVTHSWNWWKKQLRYFLPIVLDDVEKTTAAEKSAPKKRATTTRKKSATTTKAAVEEKPAAKAAAVKAAEKDEAAVAEKPAAKKAAPKAAAAKKPATKATAAKVAATEAKAEEKPAAKAPARKAAAKKAVTEEKPAAIAKAEKPAAPAKATKAAAPAKATKAAVPAKAEKSAAPAKAPAAKKPATKAATTKAAAAKRPAKGTSSAK